MEERRRPRKRRRNRSIDSLFSSKRNAKGDVVRRIVLVVSLLVLIGSLSYIIYYYYQSYANKQQISGIQDMLAQGEKDGDQAADGNSQMPTEYLAKFSKLYEANPDIAAWLKIDDTIVDYPVMQADDNDKYLRHDFYLNYKEHGVPFLDFRVKSGQSNINHIVYGHNMRDGQMFGVLPSYRDLSYYRSHPVIHFDTVYEEAQWKIFGVFITNTLPEHGDVFQYHNFVSPRNSAEFDWFVDEVKKRSFIDTGVDVQSDDTLLTLSTCTYEFTEARFVVVARKVREGEDATVDVTQAKAVDNPLMPGIWYKLFGGSAPAGLVSNPNPAGDFGSTVSAPDISNPELEDEATKEKEHEVLGEGSTADGENEEPIDDGAPIDGDAEGTIPAGPSGAGSGTSSGTSGGVGSSSGTSSGSTSGSTSSGSGSSGNWSSGSSSSSGSSGSSLNAGSSGSSGSSGNAGGTTSGPTGNSGGTSSSGGSGTTQTPDNSDADNDSLEDDYVDLDDLEDDDSFDDSNLDDYEDEELPDDEDVFVPDELQDGIMGDRGNSEEDGDNSDDYSNYDDYEDESSSGDDDYEFIPDELQDGVMSSRLGGYYRVAAAALGRPVGGVIGLPGPVGGAGVLKLKPKASQGSSDSSGDEEEEGTASSGKNASLPDSFTSDFMEEQVTVYDTRAGKRVTDTYYNILCGIVQNEVGDNKGTTNMVEEMIKAQTVASSCILTRGLLQAERTGTVYRTALKTPGKMTEDAVSQVGALLMTCDDEPVIEATYFAISSGRTNNSEDVWTDAVSYLRSVESPYDEESDDFAENILVDEDNLAEVIEGMLGITVSGDPRDWLRVKQRNEGGYVSLMSVGGQTWYEDEDGEQQPITGYAFRSLVFDNQLRSTAFQMGYSPSKKEFRFTTYGYGHGVGMSQVGANQMAKHGYTYDEILHHYYTDIEIVNRDDLDLDL